MATLNRDKKTKWFPLESNPELLNTYIADLGFDTSMYRFIDVYSTESWALDMIAGPVVAVMMLYPLTGQQEKNRKEEEKCGNQNSIDYSEVFFVKQRIGNACGTIGIIHALANLPEGLRAVALREGSWIHNFLDECPTALDPIAKAEILENDPKNELEAMHDKATLNSSAQTSRGSKDDRLDNHFISLVHVNGGLFELDGRKNGPIKHGGTNEMSLLKDACKVVEKFMARDPGELRFTILALVPVEY